MSRSIGDRLIDLGVRAPLVRLGLLAPATSERDDHQPNPVEVPFPQVAPGRLMVALTAGQSNAANAGIDPHGPVDGVFNFYQGRCWQARDPLLGASGSGGSVWMRFAKRVIASGRYDAVLLVPVAIGGTRIGLWIPGGELYPRITGAIEAVHRAGFAFTHVFWHQGESDALYGTARATYVRALTRIIAAIRARGVTAPVMVCRAAAMRDLYGHDIRAAQEEVIASVAGVVEGPDTDTLTGERYRFDRLHFNGAGFEAFADLLMAALAKA